MLFMRVTVECDILVIVMGLVHKMNSAFVRREEGGCL